MRNLRYLATPHLQGACVAVNDQVVHGLFRLKGSRRSAEPSSASSEPRRASAAATQGIERVFAFADATAKLAQNMSLATAH